MNAAPAPRDGWPPWRVALAVAGCAVVVHLGALWNGFTMDDAYIVVLNPLVQEGASPWRVFATPYWPPEYFRNNLYRPLPVLTYVLDWRLGGAAWFHAVNLLWHAGAAMGVTALATRLAGARAALVAGLLFAVHPVHVEAIAGVIGRAELMAGVLATLSVWAALTGRCAAWSLGAFAAAMFCKENAAVVPALVVWGWVLGIGRPERRRLVVLVAGWAVVVVAWALVRGAVVSPDPRFRDLAPVFIGQSPVAVRLTAVAAFADLARLLVAPLTLRADYSPLERTAVTTPADPRFLLGLAVFAGWALLVAAAWRRGRVVETFGLGWVGVALLPVSNLVITVGVLVAERTLYLPSAGLVIAVGAALARVPDARRIAVVTAALVLLGAARSAARVPVWRDDLRVAMSVLEDSPRSYRGYRHYGTIMLATRHPERALRAYRQAIAIFPYDVPMLLAAADAAFTIGRAPVADSMLIRVADLCPECPWLYEFQAATARARGDTATARAFLAWAPPAPAEEGRRAP